MLKRATLLSTLTLVAGLTLASGGSAVAQADQVDSARATFFAAKLSGANETAGGDQDGSGTAVVRIRDTEVCFLLSWSNIAAPMAAHIHMGAAGANGPVVVGFFAGALPANLTAVTGCVTSTAATVDAIRANPAGFYANIHTAEFPAGAIRGQLSKLGLVSSLDAAATMLRDSNLAALALGRNEVPGPGDADGNAIAVFKVGTDSVTFATRWRNLAAPAAAHIHSGAAGVAGPVVVGLLAAPGGLPASINGIAGTATGAADVLANIRKNPAGFYFNIHNAEFPAGAVRGQLFRIRF
jgi:hypothetical protein